MHPLVLVGVHVACVLGCFVVFRSRKARPLIHKECWYVVLAVLGHTLTTVFSITIPLTSHEYKNSIAPRIFRSLSIPLLMVPLCIRLFRLSIILQAHKKHFVDGPTWANHMQRALQISSPRRLHLLYVLVIVIHVIVIFSATKSGALCHSHKDGDCFAYSCTWHVNKTWLDSWDLFCCCVYVIFAALVVFKGLKPRGQLRSEVFVCNALVCLGLCALWVVGEIDSCFWSEVVTAAFGPALIIFAFTFQLLHLFQARSRTTSTVTLGSAVHSLNTPPPPPSATRSNSSMLLGVVTLEMVLRNKRTREAFAVHVANEFSSENLVALQEIDAILDLLWTNVSHAVHRAQALCENHLLATSPIPINIPPNVCSEAADAINEIARVLSSRFPSTQPSVVRRFSAIVSTTSRDDLLVNHEKHAQQLNHDDAVVVVVNEDSNEMPEPKRAVSQPIDLENGGVGGFCEREVVEMRKALLKVHRCLNTLISEDSLVRFLLAPETRSLCKSELVDNLTTSPGQPRAKPRNKKGLLVRFLTPQAEHDLLELPRRSVTLQPSVSMEVLRASIRSSGKFFRTRMGQGQGRPAPFVPILHHDQKSSRTEMLELIEREPTFSELMDVDRLHTALEHNVGMAIMEIRILEARGIQLPMFTSHEVFFGLSSQLSPRLNSRFVPLNTVYSFAPNPSFDIHRTHPTFPLAVSPRDDSVLIELFAHVPFMDDKSFASVRIALSEIPREHHLDPFPPYNTWLPLSPQSGGEVHIEVVIRPNLPPQRLLRDPLAWFREHVEQTNPPSLTLEHGLRSLEKNWDKFKTGDVILFATPASVYGLLTEKIFHIGIERVTHSPFTHVGIVVVTHDSEGKKHVLIVEVALNDDKIPDFFEGTDTRRSLYVFSIVDRMLARSSMVYLPLKEALSPEQTSLVEKFLFKVWHEDLLYDYKNFYKASLAELAKTVIGRHQQTDKYLDVNEDWTQFMCSEFVAAALKLAFPRLDRLNTSMISPAGFVSLNVFEDHAEALLVMQKHTIDGLLVMWDNNKEDSPRHTQQLRDSVQLARQAALRRSGVFG